jgi:hypothetical protein
MGGKSKTSTEANQSTSEVNNTTSTNTQTNTSTQTDASRNVALEDVEFGVAAGGDLSFQQVNNTTDFGAVEAGIKAATGSLDRSLDFGSEALDFSGDVVDRSLKSVDDATEGALGFGSESLQAAFGFGNRALDSVTANAAQSASKLGNAIDQAAAATRSDAAASIDKIGKYATIAAVVVAVAVAAVFIFKK